MFNLFFFHHRCPFLQVIHYFNQLFNQVLKSRIYKGFISYTFGGVRQIKHVHNN